MHNGYDTYFVVRSSKVNVVWKPPHGLPANIVENERQSRRILENRGHRGVERVQKTLANARSRRIIVKGCVKQFGFGCRMIA